MSKGVDIKLVGFDKVLNLIEQGDDLIIREVDGIMEAGSKFFVRNAKQAAQRFGDTGALAREIVYERRSLMNFSIVSGARYAGYVEFGTGSKFRSIPGFEDIAASIRGKTGLSYKEGLDNIKGWVKRKGIRFNGMTQQQTAFLIFRSILRNGIKAQPYFFKNMGPTRAQIEKDLGNVEKALR